MKLDELEAVLQDAARRQPADEHDIYPAVVRTARRRRVIRRVSVATGTVACVAAIALGWLAVNEASDSSPARVHVAQTPASGFVPPSSIRDGNLVVPITFLSGGHAEVVVPSDAFDAHRLTFVPGGAINWSGSPDLGRTVEVVHGTINSVFPGQQPIAQYRDALGQRVPLYAGASDNKVNYLAFEFGDWVVKVWDYPEGDPRGAAMTDQQRQFWAAHLGGHVTKSGFLVLDPIAPLVNSTTDEPDATLSDGPNTMGIIFRDCAGPELEGDRTAHGYIESAGAPGPVLCAPDIPVVIWLGGNESLQRAANSLELRNLEPPLPTIRW